VETGAPIAQQIMAGGSLCQFGAAKDNGDIVHDLLSENIEVLRARADRFRRLARDLFDPSISETAARLAEELDDEIARLLRAPKPVAVPVRCH
jgi:hypothetical protein